MLPKLAAMMKALGHPHRLQLFTLLRSQQFCCYVATPPPAGELGACVGDLRRECGLPASTLSHHLKELRTAGLVEMERHGQIIFCRVNDSALAELRAFLSEAPAELVNCEPLRSLAPAATEEHPPQGSRGET
jgi:DNA-binding transcriptional ArsR family regulator